MKHNNILYDKSAKLLQGHTCWQNHKRGGGCRDIREYERCERFWSRACFHRPQIVYYGNLGGGGKMTIIF